MSNLNKIIVGLIIFLISACANIRQPTGGPKDTDPPILITSSPINKALNFNGKRLDLIFNEWVTLNNLNQQLIITPFSDYKYETIQKKNTLTLTFDKPFPSNSTISLNFRDGIKDITEGNIIKTLKVAFSTGNTIDSIKINGNVTDLLTNIPVNDATVGLYIITDTLSPKKQKPYYFTKTDDKGAYKIDNIKAGKYFLVSFLDKNNNLLYDGKSEKIGFINQFINLTKDTIINISQYTNDNEPPKLISKTAETNFVRFTFNEGIRNIKIDTSLSKHLFYNINTENNKVNIFSKLIQEDSTSLIFSVSDSAGNYSKHNIKVKFKEKKSENKKDQQPNAISFAVDKGQNIVAEEGMSIVSFEPIDTIYANAISVQSDSGKTIEITDYELNPNRNIIGIKQKGSTPLPKKNITYYVKLNSIKTISGLLNKADTAKYNIEDERNLGVLSGTIAAIINQDFIIQVLDEKYSVIKEVFNQRKFKIKNIKPGNYYVRVIADVNKNKQWDPGSLENKINPEQIYWYKNKIILKANWEVENINI